MPRLGLAVHERFGGGEALRRAPLDGVGGERERRAAEPDERDAPVELAAYEPDRVEHVAERLARLEDLQPIHVGGRAERAFDRRTLAVHEVEGHAHRLERQQQIREEDGRVHLDGAHGLQCDLGGQLGRSAEVEQRVALAQRAVLRHVAAGLAHEPDRRGVHRLAPARQEESIRGSRVGHEETRARASATEILEPERLEAHGRAERLEVGSHGLAEEVIAGHDGDRHVDQVRPRANGAQELQAVHDRHAQVEDDRVGADLFGQLEAQLRVERRGHLEPLEFEHARKRVGDGTIVVNDQDRPCPGRALDICGCSGHAIDSLGFRPVRQAFPGGWKGPAAGGGRRPPAPGGRASRGGSTLSSGVRMC